jgi:hypothetical protein
VTSFEVAAMETRSSLSARRDIEELDRLSEASHNAGCVRSVETRVRSALANTRLHPTASAWRMCCREHR